MRKFLLSLFGIIFASGLFLATPAHAADINFQIRPTSNAFTLSAGNTHSYSFAVSNTGDSELTYKVYAKPYSMSNVNGSYVPTFSDITNTHAQMYRWITFRTSEGDFSTTAIYKIAAGESQTITYHIDIPSELAAGGQYAAIFAEVIPDTTSTSDASVTAVPKVTLLLYGHGAGDTIESGDITDYRLSGMLTSGNISGSAKVVNNGNTDFSATCEFTVSSLFGRVYYTSAYSYPILPETEYRVASEWPDTPSFGIFSVKFSVEALDNTIDKTRIVIVMPFFMMIIMLLLLTAIIIWIIILIRKRKERNSRLVI